MRIAVATVLSSGSGNRLFQYPASFAYGRSPDGLKYRLRLGKRILLGRKENENDATRLLVVGVLGETAEVLRPRLVRGDGEDAEVLDAERILKPLLAVVPPVRPQLVEELFFSLRPAISFEEARIFPVVRIQHEKRIGLERGISAALLPAQWCRIKDVMQLIYQIYL